MTLTYDPAHVPPDGSLVLKDFQDFMKRLRFRKGPGVRFFHCGEYGEKNSRPHYHACLFNVAFADRELWKVVNDQRYYVSQEVSELWPYGWHTLGDVTFESAAYVARYITKKVTGENADWHYNDVDWHTGEILASRKPEYVTMSRRPGIGSAWIDQWMEDSFKDDSVIVRGRPMRPPKAYLKRFEDRAARSARRVKNLRKAKARKQLDKGLDQRLEVREQIQQIRLKQLKRGLENAD